MSIRRLTDGVLKKLAEQRAQVCMLGLSEMQEPWPCGGWILSVFVRMLEKVQSRTIKATINVSQEEHTASQSNVLYVNMDDATREPHQPCQDRPIMDQSHGAEIQMGQFSIDDSTFMLDMLNEPDFSFPDDLRSDLIAQIPYSGEFSMLNI